jgi:hypothetical protein
MSHCQPFSAFATGLTPIRAKHLGSFLAECPHFLTAVVVTPISFAPCTAAMCGIAIARKHSVKASNEREKC